ncbi:MAG: hypothetical protein GC191_12695 [Azospirillum sp.]|nr:hypothetical protein [Azospirillum sp.]
MNPEFQRNLWLEIPAHRLIAMPAVLALVFIATWLGGGREAFPWVAELTLGVLLIVWGSRLAADAVLGEVSARTWDGQRMSAISPWDMTWGKLYGSTIYVWYGAAWCAIAHLFGHGTLVELIRLLLSGLQAQALALLVSLLLMRRGVEGLRSQVALAQIVAMLVMIPLQFLIPVVPSSHVSWFRLAVPQPAFVILSQLVFLGWTVMGVYRMIRAELQYRSDQSTWIGFVLFFVVYISGFDFILLASAKANLPSAVMARLLVAFCAAVGLTYIAAFLESKNLVRMRLWVGYAQIGRLSRMLEITPIWVFSLSVAVLLAAATVADLFMVAPPTATAPSSLAPFVFAVLLFCIRDLGMLYYLVLHDRPRRGHMTALIYLVVLYFVAPVALSTAKLDVLVPVLVPSASGPAELVVLPVLIQAAVAIMLALQRWRAIRVVEMDRGTIGA